MELPSVDAAQEPRSAQLKSGRWRLKPSGVDSQDECATQQIGNTFT